MKQLGYSKGYQYDHDAEGGVALGQTGFPDAMGERVYYEPVERGLEIKLKEKLDRLRTQRARARDERSEEHTSELQSLKRNTYAVLRLQKKIIIMKKHKI